MNEDLTKKVNEVVDQMVQSDDGKWAIPEEVAKDLSPEMTLAVTAERRFRDTQGSYTRTRQELKQTQAIDRKSTRLNSSHTVISYAVFRLKKKKKKKNTNHPPQNDKKSIPMNESLNNRAQRSKLINKIQSLKYTAKSFTAIYFLPDHYGQPLTQKI